jgi:hypothetical protein
MMSLEINVVRHNDTETVSSLVEIERNAFGPNGLSEWEIVPFIRHGLVIALKLDGFCAIGAIPIMRIFSVSLLTRLTAAKDSAHVFYQTAA